MYTYKIKFIIFGKEMATTIKANNTFEMAQKLCVAVLSQMRPSDCTVFDEAGKEVQPQDYIESQGHIPGLIKALTDAINENKLNGFSAN